MKVLSNFDRVVSEVLADKVKSRLNFKVGCSKVEVFRSQPYNCLLADAPLCRVTWRLTASAMMSGPSWSRTFSSNASRETTSRPIKSRSLAATLSDLAKSKDLCGRCGYLERDISSAIGVGNYCGYKWRSHFHPPG